MAESTIVAGHIVAVDIAGREFPVPADCRARLDVGGVENTVDTAGSGAAFVTQTSYPWHTEGLELRISEDRGDLGFLAGVFNEVVGLSSLTSGLAIEAPPSGPDRKFLSEVAARGKLVPISVTLADGSVYSGRGTIVGRRPVGTNDAVLPLTLMGDGQMVKQ